MSIPLYKKHEFLLGKKATAKQASFYNKFPEFRGLSDRSLDPEILEAVLISALMFGTVRDRVCILAPLAHENWVLEQFNKTADIVFEICKKQQDKVAVAKSYSLLFKKIVILGKILQIPEPSHWVSFGFAVSDPIPPWVEFRLLEAWVDL